MMNWKVFGGIWKEAAVASASFNLLESTEENHENPQLEYPVLQVATCMLITGLHASAAQLEYPVLQVATCMLITGLHASAAEFTVQGSHKTMDKTETACVGWLNCFCRM
jgi:hypothetical protein